MRTKFTRFFALLAFLLTSAFFSFAQSPTDLFISEYVEGSSNNKAIELYNGTGSPINLSTGNYVIQMYFNGSTSATTVITLTGVVAPNSVFVLAQSSASFASSSFVNQTNGASWYNGDDAVVLRKGGTSGTVVDVIGQVGFDPGTEWGTGLISTADNTLRRKAGDCTGDTNPNDVFDPSIKYDGFATDVFTGLGTHTSSCTPGASITLNPLTLNFSTNPGVPSAQQSYTVQGSSLTDDIVISVPALSNFGVSTVSGGPYSAGLTIPAATANAGAVTVYVVFSPAAAGNQSGNITHTSGTTTANLAVTGTTASPDITPIFVIQGSGSASLLVGQTLTTQGIVTSDFQGANQLGGFFIQDTTGDGNNLTSDGIFVFDTTFHVSVGDYVRVTGTVVEFFNKTELNTITSPTILSSGNTLPAPVSITLPVNAIADLERYEGMRVTFPQTLTATETSTLGRFGEISLSANGRRFNPTDFIDPNDNPPSGTSSSGTSNVAAVTAQQSLNDRSRILLDDGSNVEDPAIVPYLNPADTTFRLGTTVTDLTGAMDFDFSQYRLHPTGTPVFLYAPRPAVPSVGEANVKIAGFNVLNYFNGNGSGGGFPTSRGADNLPEFNRQRAKIIAAIKQLDADVVGLTEIENDGDGALSAIADLVNGLNAATSPGTYALVNDPTGSNGNTGSDEIKVAFIYKPSKVTPFGSAKADINPVHNRPPLAQTWTLTGNNEKFTTIINHFKSKSCTGASGSNTDQGDGQACFNANRKLQASALLTFIGTIQASSGDSDVVLLGDFNAYDQEDPMDIMRAGGFSALLPGNYSYVFKGQSGSLDHVLTSPSLFLHVTGVSQWHINSDEPVAKDYNTEFYPAYLYSPGPFRSSDHDPVMVGLNLQPPFVNTPPTLSDANRVINEDDSLQFEKVNFTSVFADANGDTLVKIKITRLPVNGSLTLGSTAVSLNQEIPAGSIGGLKYKPAANFNGVDTIGWNGSDGADYAVSAANISITINSVNDKPIVSIALPSAGSYPAGSVLSMRVNAQDVDGTILLVEFFDKGVRFGQDNAAPFESGNHVVEAGDYVLTATAYDSNGDSTISDTVRITVTGCAGTGSILGEGYTDIFGSRVTDLTNNPKYPNSPDVVASLNKMEYSNFGDYYGGRLRGYICAPVTGNYLFYIASDEQCELWLSTDDNPANKRRIAFLTSPVASRGWFTYYTQQSAPIFLVKGVKYYIETLHKEATGADHLSVAWKIPGVGLEGPIPGTRLIPWSDSVTLSGVITSRTGIVNFEKAMRDATNVVKGLSVKATPNPSTNYFTLATRSSSDRPINIVVTDALGRLIEKKTGVAANGTVQIGNKLSTGVYFVEVMQGTEKVRLKLIRN